MFEMKRFSYHPPTARCVRYTCDNARRSGYYYCAVGAQTAPSTPGRCEQLGGRGIPNADLLATYLQELRELRAYT